jgi:MoaA/NifB/PqqE/SkfB family radical SAM enzyme
MMSKVASWFGYGFKTFILKQELPYLFGMVITDKCNLNCFYCESKNSGRYHFSFDQAKKTIRDAYKRGHRSLYFTGGEPMIWEDNGHDLDELVRFARDIGFLDVFIFTNGTRPLSIANSNYIVTVDGPKDIHDKIRSNSHDVILENARNAVTKNVFASITFSKANVQHLHRFVEEVNGTKLFKGISFNLLTHWPEIVQEHGISLEERKKLLDDIWQLKGEGYPIVLSRAAYKALRNNDWKRPIPLIELGTKDRIFQCCRDIDNPSVCAQCGYANCAEVSQMLSLKPSALWQVLRMVGPS